MRKRLWAVSVAILWSVALAWGQASVDEGLETAHLYVDSVKGSDSNTGTAQRPLRTIGKAASLAAANNQKGVGTKVTIAAGTYRESLALASGPKSTSAPITFEAATEGAAIVSGADVWTGWTAYGGNSAIFTHSWPYQWGLCSRARSGPFEQDIVLRREMIFVNGTPLTQVLAFNQMAPGTFFVDEAHQRVYIQPAAGTSIATAAVEVSTRSSLLTLTGGKNLVWRGLAFEKAGSCRNNSAVLVTGWPSDVLFDSDQFVWNNAQGLHVSQASDVTVENSVANHNGEAGLGGYQVKDSRWSNDEASYNNWRGAQGAYYNWNSSGAHFMLMHGATFNGLTTSFNQTHGVHWDTDNAGITADSLTSTNNLLVAAFVELSQGPVSISNSLLGNDAPSTAPNQMALVLRNSSYVTLTGSTLKNGSSQIQVTGQKGGLGLTDWETGQPETIVTRNFAMTATTIEGGLGEPLFNDALLGGNDWTLFAGTLASDYNTWWNASVKAPFTVPTPRAGSALDLSGWQSLTHQDAHSVFAAPPPGAAPQALPDAADFWFTSNSPSLGVQAGGSATFLVSVTPLASRGTVLLAGYNVQSAAGVRTSWSRTSVAGSGTASFKVMTGSSTPKGTYPFTLTARCGSLTRTVTVSVVVN